MTAADTGMDRAELLDRMRAAIEGGGFEDAAEAEAVTRGVYSALLEMEPCEARVRELEDALRGIMDRGEPADFRRGRAVLESRRGAA